MMWCIFYVGFIGDPPSSLLLEKVNSTTKFVDFRRIVKRTHQREELSKKLSTKVARTSSTLST